MMLSFMSRQRDVGNSWLGIRDALSQSLKQVGFDPETSTDRAGLYWALAVGKEIAAVSQVIKVAPKTLYVEVKGKEWLLALEALKQKLIGEIRHQAGYEDLTQIIFKEELASNSFETRSRVSVKNNTHSNSDAAKRSSRRPKRRE